MDKKLIFVYNANSGVWNSVLDSAHKILKPNSYSCNLCAITHGVIGEKSVWKKYRKSSNFKMEFYHKDGFLKAFASKYLLKFDFPVVLFAENGELELLISKEELEGISSVEKLIKILQKRA
ncbi:GTPase [Zunongwangia endophytica]|uniref:GTPase n=1 Tax=Zunongwangia endophytica TaxID=1808945 RepID=A0ABV8H5V3_9FLAO|nr:GTPase [Zunongwangia endophytica]MDN3596482.1 GTPase [Zunongwangia endophytica]